MAPTTMQRRTSLPIRAAFLGLVPACFALACAMAPRSERSQAQAANGAEPVKSRGYDVEHYAIDLELFPAERRIQGSCRVRLAPSVAELPEVALDLQGLSVSAVRDASGADLAFTREKNLLRIALPAPAGPGETVDLTVHYGGTPVTGLWFSGRRGDGTGPNQVFTQGQARQNSGWFPCFDHPSDRATSELRVTMPAGWRSVAPGALVEEQQDVQRGTVTEHWRMDTPHASYLASLVAGEFEVHESDWEGVTLLVLAEPKYEDWLENSFDETDEILSFLSDYTGVRYPYPKYSQAVVANFPWGGMENISATTLTPLVLDDERGNRGGQPEALVAHEAAHQWFGDLVTCNDWSDVWLNEGFATYMELLYFEHSRGTDDFRARMRAAQDLYVTTCRGEKRRPIVWNVYKEPEDLFDAHPYEGAATRLHLLRFVLGDEVFRAGVRTYVAENAGRNVVTADFQRAMEKASGRDLDQFFEEWLLRPGYPEFDVSWDWDPKKESVALIVKQVQDGALFHTPVEIEIRDQSGTSTHRIDVTRRLEEFEFSAAGKPFYVRFDKGGWIPKTVKWTYAPSEWIAIATSDDDVTGRRDAVHALGEVAAADREKNPAAHETYVAELSTRLRRDPSPWVRAGAATALGRAGGLEGRERLAEAARSDEAPEVRTAALQALASWGENRELAELGYAAFEDGYSWSVMGAAAGLVCAADPRRAYGWLTEKLFLDSPHDQLAAHLLHHLGTLPDPAVNTQLARWMRDSAVHGKARAVAVTELARRQGHLASTVREIAELLDEEEFCLRQAVVEALAATRSPESKAILREYYAQARNASERRVIEAALIGERR